MRKAALTLCFLVAGLAPAWADCAGSGCVTLVMNTTVAQDIVGRWVTLYNAGDAKGIAALFTKDGLFSPAAGILLHGRAEIAKTVAARISDGFNKETVSVLEEHRIGDVAWATGQYDIVGSGKNDGKHVAGHFGAVYVLERGGWHIAQLTGNGIMKALEHHADGGGCTQC